MKLFQSICTVAILVCATSIVAQEQAKDAQCTKCPASAGKKCCASATTTVSTSATDEKCAGCGSEKACATCAVSKAMAMLPKMTYKVGTELTCCSQSAAALAKKHGKPVHYVVGEATFEDQSKAYVSLVESTEKFVTEYATPKTCSVSGTTSVAGKSCGCSVEAGKRAELAKKAMEEVKMTFKVGSETTCCNDSAKALAKKSGDEIKFVVNEKEICCNYQARLELAQAKFAAAVKALAAAEAKTATAEKVGT